MDRNSPQWMNELRTQMEQEAPNDWTGVRQRLARQLAEQLLDALDGIPSAKGQLFFEYASHASVVSRAKAQ